jgi:DNA-binding beta-propeller fold protein YncE/mono/diheme cytochrome c family protein
VPALVATSPTVRSGTGEAHLSPSALAATKDGQSLFVACATGRRVLRLEVPSRQVRVSIPLPAAPSGLALSPDERCLFITCAAAESRVAVLDVASATVVAWLPAGHTALAPVVNSTGDTLYVCHRFNNEVGVFDLRTRRQRARVPVLREPTAAALTPDGKYLLVANHLHAGRADSGPLAAVVSVIDTRACRVVKELVLPNGSGALNDLRISPDGRYAVVTHLLARSHLPTTQVERGWMNTNAATLIDLAQMEILNTVLLDEVDRGAANPWGAAWSPDSRTLAVTHAGTHELSVIDVPALVEKLSRLTEAGAGGASAGAYARAVARNDVPNDLAFLLGTRKRVRLPASERGPRAVAFIGACAWVANYFSDTLSAVDCRAPQPGVESVALGPRREMNAVRRGEFWFHNAEVCFQGWQSCASCHPGDARVDGLNWDLLNDGLGNPKNTRNLLLAHRTPPAMSLGVRETAETAVRAGLRHILFSVPPPDVAASIDEYLKSLQPVPSPWLVGGKLSAAAKRGRAVFGRAGCAVCHPAKLFTDLRPYDVGTRGPTDRLDDRYDTPTLIEVWRTAPYLHDGSAATVREVLGARNARDQHGRTSALTAQELDDLCAYVLSL